MIVRFFILFCFWLSPAIAETWTPDYTQSHIVFTSTELGAPFEGKFKSFTADIFFDLENMDKNSVTVTIDTTSIFRDTPKRNATLRQAEFFDIDTYTTAIFKSDHFERTGEETYIAHGFLKVKNVEHPFNLPFHLTLQDAQAIMTANVDLNRLDFNIGTGEWADTDFLKDKVTLDIRLTATRQNTP